MMTRILVGLVLSPFVVVGLAGDHPGEGAPAQDVLTVEVLDREAHTDAVSNLVISVKVPRSTTTATSQTAVLRLSNAYTPIIPHQDPVKPLGRLIDGSRSDFDQFTDDQADAKVLDESCGVTDRPCHIPVAVYVAQQPTLRQLVIRFFDPADWGWAIRVAFCESSGQPDDWYSDAVAGSSGATGWFQHLPQYWDDRSSKAGFSGFPANHPVANVGVAAWLLYSTPQGKGHWWPSEHCWGEQQ